MQAHVEQPASIRERMISLRQSVVAANALALAILAVWCTALFYYLLARFPYDGLYGQDSYAYYYQARALLQDMTGQAPQPWQLFSAGQLNHWPIGYHLHLILGQIITGSYVGGRAITVCMAVGAALVLYLLVGELWTGGSNRARMVAGLVAGGALPLVATYTRMGLSLMADVPAVFWGLLGVYCCLRAWPVGVPSTEYRVVSADDRREFASLSTEYRRPTDGRPATRYSVLGTRYSAAWAIAGGAALGIAVLIRYGAVFFLIPVGVYWLIRWFQRNRSDASSRNEPSPWWAVLGFVVALLPQVAYLLAYKSPGSAGLLGSAGVLADYSSWLDGWAPANLLSTTVSGPDGTSTFSYPMIVFYLVQPLFDSDAGFLSVFYLPALLVGAVVLVRERVLPVIGLLLSWWLLPVLFFAGTPYQAHRFALTYIPALLVVLGIGSAAALEAGISALRGKIASRARVLSAGLALVVMLGLVAGVYREQASVKSWMAIHESFQADEQKVAAIARQAAGSYPSADPPHVVAFGVTAALYHYTQWPTIDLFNHGEDDLQQFLAAPGPRLLVLPVDAMAGQWANTPLAARWQWLQQAYMLAPQGVAGMYTVYTIGNRP